MLFCKGCLDPSPLTAIFKCAFVFLYNNVNTSFQTVTIPRHLLCVFPNLQNRSCHLILFSFTVILTLWLLIWLLVQTSAMFGLICVYVSLQKALLTTGTMLFLHGSCCQIEQTHYWFSSGVFFFKFSSPSLQNSKYRWVQWLNVIYMIRISPQVSFNHRFCWSMIRYSSTPPQRSSKN